MNTRLRLGIAFVLLAVLPLGLLAGISLSHQRASAVEETLGRLDGLAQAHVAHLDNIINSDNELTMLLAGNGRLEEALVDHKAGRTPSDDELATVLDAAMQASDRLLNITLYADDGVAVASWDDSAPLRYDVAGLAPGIMDIPHRVVRGPGGVPTMLTSATLIDDGQELGVVIIETDATPIADLAATNIGLGQTGETSIAQPTAEGAQFIAPLRFQDGAVLNLTIPWSVEEAPITAAISGIEAKFEETVDYRGSSVFAVTRHLEETDWGVVVKIDRDEALAGVRDFQNTLYLVFGSVLLMVLAVSWLVSRSIWRPVTELTASAVAVANGTRDRRANVHTGGELGRLATAVNRMTDDLVRAAAHANDRQRELEVVNARLTAREEELRSIFENAADGIVTVTNNGTVHRLNRAGEELFGITAGEATGMPIAGLLSSSRIPAEQLFAGAATAGSDGVNMTAVHAKGHLIPVHVAVSQVEANGDSWFTGAVRDMSDRVAFEKRLSHQATHDDVTGLPNRAYLRKQLELALDEANGLRTKVAVLFVDLDQFKLVNDSRGHAAGDNLLTAVGHRLSSAAGTEIVARFGGDEFVVLAPSIRDASDAEQLARRLHDAFAEPIELGGESEHVSCSIGVALSSGDADPDELISDADVAMYRAKSAGRNRTVMFDADMRAWVEARHQLESALRQAIENEEINVHYQPIVEIGTGEFCGVESLARWNRPDHGAVSPADFIPVAEDSGLIVPLGRSVLRQACEQQRRWANAHPGDVPRITVNMSARELTQADCVMAVQRILRETGADPKGIMIEVTETALSGDLNLAIKHLHELRDLGLSIAVDDFGTGYSSLTYLRQFPLDIVKIDRSFMSELDTGSTDSSIVSLVINLGRSLGIVVVAEGVETEAQLQTLTELGCDCAQGYLFARPQAGADIEKLLWPEYDSVLPRIGEPSWTELDAA